MHASNQWQHTFKTNKTKSANRNSLQNPKWHVPLHRHLLAFLRHHFALRVRVCAVVLLILRAHNQLHSVLRRSNTWNVIDIRTNLQHSICSAINYMLVNHNGSPCGTQNPINGQTSTLISGLSGHGAQYLYVFAVATWIFVSDTVLQTFRSAFMWSLLFVCTLYYCALVSGPFQLLAISSIQISVADTQKRHDECPQKVKSAEVSPISAPFECALCALIDLVRSAGV